MNIINCIRKVLIRIECKLNIKYCFFNIFILILILIFLILIVILFLIRYLYCKYDNGECKNYMRQLIIIKWIVIWFYISIKSFVDNIYILMYTISY